MQTIHINMQNSSKHKRYLINYATSIHAKENQQHINFDGFTSSMT